MRTPLTRAEVLGHAWRAGEIGYNTVDCQLLQSTCGQRRLYVATLKAASDGKLKVKKLY